MTHESLLNRDWQDVIRWLGGAAAIEASARETKAFLRARAIDNAVDLLRVILAYCLGERGLRSTAAWAAAIGLVDISNVALLYRLRQCGDWLALLVGQALAAAAPEASRGRLIRIIDATTVPKAGTLARTKNRLWRVHGAFDLPSERFGFFELTDEKGGETLDRVPVIKVKSVLATVPICSLIAWRPSLMPALTCWCGPVGGVHVGSMPTANRSIFLPSSARERHAG